MSTASTTRTRHDAAIAPTVGDVRDGLRATLDADDFDRVWADVCRTTSISPDASTVSEATLDHLLTEISAQDRLCNVLAMSWRIRCTAARKLAELGR